MTSFVAGGVKLGFIGLGNMGSRIARRLLEHGYTVFVYDREVSKAKALEPHGARVANSLGGLAREADVVLSSLPNDELVRGVYTAADGVLVNAKPGTVVIEMSTVLPATSRELCSLAMEHGVTVLDVAISGSTPLAEKGALTLLAGGDAELFQAAEPIFQAIAQRYFRLGPSGAGTTMKLVVNTLLGVGMQAIAEALAFGEKAGLPRDLLFYVLSQTAVVAPAHIGKLENAARDSYSPQFPLPLMNKDFHLILQTAAAMNVSMPATWASFQVNSAEATAGNEEDFSVVIRHMEQIANIVPGEKISA